MLNSKGYCGRSLISPRSQKMEVNPANMQVTNCESFSQILTRWWCQHTSPGTHIPAGACWGQSELILEFKKQGCAPPELLCQPPWHCQGHSHPGLGCAGLPSPWIGRLRPHVHPCREDCCLPQEVWKAAPSAGMCEKPNPAGRVRGFGSAPPRGCCGVGRRFGHPLVLPVSEKNPFCDLERGS